ncbi:MAG: glycosyltransferase [Pseudomonadota bacterium]
MPANRFDPISSLARPVMHGLRELPIRMRAIRQGRGARIVLLPAYGREGAALLRIYNVAEVLQRRGVDLHVLPPKLTLAGRRRCLAALNPDVVLMQGTRHALNRPALYPDQRIFLDLDDGDFHLPHLAPSVREAMRHVDGVTAGSAYLADWCRQAGARAVHVIWTGAPISQQVRPPQAGRPPVLAWSQTRPMTYTHEAALLRDVIRAVGAAHPGVTLRLYDRCAGDDPAFAQSFEAPGVTVEWFERAGYASYLKSFDDVAIGLAPLVEIDPFCRGKSFGKVLAYLDRQVPVVASDAGEPRAFFTPETGRLCKTGADWRRAIGDLLRDDAARTRLAAAAFTAFRRDLSVEKAATDLMAVLETALLVPYAPRVAAAG